MLSCRFTHGNFTITHIVTMDIPVMKPQEMNEEKDIFRLLDRGIDDMKEKRELPVDEAFEMITKLRTARRNERA